MIIKEHGCLQSETLSVTGELVYSLIPELEQYCIVHGITYKFDMSHFSTKVLGNNIFYIIFTKNEKNFSITSEIARGIKLYSMINLLEAKLNE